MQLTKNFTLSEFTKSAKATELGIINTPGLEEIDNLNELCKHVLQPIRDAVDASLIVSSGFRNTALNEAVGGVATSQHTKGQAADISTSKMTATELFKLIVNLDLPYDQVILYNSFVHVSYKPYGETNRKQILYAKGVDEINF